MFHRLNKVVNVALSFSKHPDLYKNFKDFLGYKESGSVESVPQGALKERISSDLALEIGALSEPLARSPFP